MEKMPVALPVATGVGVTVHVRPASASAAPARPSCRSRCACRAPRRSCRWPRTRPPRARPAAGARPGHAPSGAAIRGHEDDELAIHRIAERDPVRGIGERHRIEEHLGVVIGELQRPVRAAVRGPVDPRRVAGTDAEHGRDASLAGIDVAEVERFGSRHGTWLPCRAAIGGPQHRAALTAGPGDLPRHRTHAAQAHRHAAVERLPTHPLLGTVRSPAWPREQREWREQSSWRGLYRRGGRGPVANHRASGFRVCACRQLLLPPVVPSSHRRRPLRPMSGCLER